MLAKLKSLLAGGNSPEQSGARKWDPLHLAAATLMVEAAQSDDDYAVAEREKIGELLAGRFDLDEADAEALICHAEERAEQAVEIYSLTREVKDRFTEAERLELMEMLWEIAYLDGQIHDWEAALMRRLAGLLYVSDKASGEAKRKAREALLSSRGKTGSAR